MPVFMHFSFLTTTLPRLSLHQGRLRAYQVSELESGRFGFSGRVDRVEECEMNEKTVITPADMISGE